MKQLLLIALISVLAYSQDAYQITPNSKLYQRDTLIVSRDSVRYTKIFFQNDGMEKTIKITVDDTTIAGFASDTFAATYELYQTFGDWEEKDWVDIFPSRAHPDSSYPGGTDYALFDSLHIANMDTATQYQLAVKKYKTGAGGDTLSSIYGKTLDSLMAAPIGAKVYLSIAPDYSPGLLIKCSGKMGKEAIVIIEWYIREGTPTR